MTNQPQGQLDIQALRKLMEDQLALSRRLRGRIAELEAERHAPLAVVGMAMRFPGGIDTPQAYWEFLCGRQTGYRQIPEDRPGLRAVYDPEPGKPGRSYVDRAGFLDDIAGFDAEFFGISRHEAQPLDPHQRLLLECAWEALERSGLAVRRTDRLDVGVYLGIMASEYTERFEDPDDRTGIDPYYTTGGGLCFAAGRISHALGLRGPVFSIDTACSSSLSALHLAARGLRDRECRYALVCGSNLLLSANLMVSLCQTRALSPDGRSKSFLATADGYGRGEGVGAVALMRLADAEAERRPILAVLRGTASNHDGAASGLTVPNGPAQQEVIAAALADSGVDAADLGWIEAHGTGTALGDPIEIGALAAVVGDAVRDRGVPLYLGSVKSRLGHMEAASGIAAVLKTVLMLHHGRIPAAADAGDGDLNPHIPWKELAFDVPRQTMAWPEGLAKRVAGINSFGMSGTNVHAVFEAHRRPDPAQSLPDSAPSASERPADPGHLLVLSARSPAALSELVDAIVSRLRKTADAELPSVCHTLRAGRAAFAHRVAVVGAGAEELADALRAAPAARAESPRPLSLRVGADAERVAEGCAAIAAAFPLLAEDAAQGPSAVLTRLGIRVRRSSDGELPPGVAAAVAGEDWSLPLLGVRAAESPAMLVAMLRRAFEAGADLRLDALRPATAGFVGDLPTYPFQRERFWVPEPERDTTAEAGTVDRAHSSAVPVPADPDHGRLTEYLAAELAYALQATEPLDLSRSPLESGCDSFIFQLFITRVEENFPIGLTPDDLPLDLTAGELIRRLADDIHHRLSEAGRGPGR